MHELAEYLSLDQDECSRFLRELLLANPSLCPPIGLRSVESTSAGTILLRLYDVLGTETLTVFTSSQFIEHESRLQ